MLFCSTWNSTIQYRGDVADLSLPDRRPTLHSSTQLYICLSRDQVSHDSRYCSLPLTFSSFRVRPSDFSVGSGQDSQFDTPLLSAYAGSLRLLIACHVSHCTQCEFLTFRGDVNFGTMLWLDLLAPARVALPISTMC